MWKEGFIVIDKIAVKYCMKVYEEPSMYGINNGRISKLTLKIKGTVVASYDRDWDIKPTCIEAEKALVILLYSDN